MKKNILTLLLVVFALNVVHAQNLTKTQIKSLKKEIKAYKKSPEKWAKMKKDHKTKVTQLSDEIVQLTDQLKAEKLRGNQLNDKNLALEEKLKMEQIRYVELEKTIPSAELPNGTVYQVQIGYYQYLDLASFNDKLKTIRAEEVDGKKRYVIGHFDTMVEAVQFSNDIKRLGISDAFVTEYIDGERNMDFDAFENL